MSPYSLHKEVDKLRAFAIAAHEMMGGHDLTLPPEGLEECGGAVKTMLQHVIEHADFLLDAIDAIAAEDKGPRLAVAR